MMDRRAFVNVLALGLATAPLIADAQPARKVYRIGHLMGGSPSTAGQLWEGYRQRLRELGYVEGQNPI